jgi:membrane protease YdiL (CAAX protease family)
LLGCFGCLVTVTAALAPQVDPASLLLFTQAAALPAVTVSVYIARRWLDRRSFASLGLQVDRSAWRDLLIGFGIAGVMMGFIYLLESAAGWLTFAGPAWQFEPTAQVAMGVLAMLVIFISVGWYEELLNRGYWLQNLEEGLNLPVAVLISSLVFASAHLANPNLSVTAFAGLILAGIFLAYGYTRTRRLWLPIGLHIGWNFFEGTVFGFAVSGIEATPRLIYKSVHGPELLTGGAFGPEAGLVVLPALALGAALVYLYTRGRTRQA